MPLIRERREIMDIKVCSFTGHRVIEARHKDKLMPLLMRGIEYVYSRGCRTFLSGGAIGFDTLAARAVLEFKKNHSDISLVLVLPCKNQSEKWSAAQKAEYERILSLADEVRYITDAYYDGCIKERNLALAEGADVFIAYAHRFNSGTGQTVRMAINLKKEVYNLYPELDKNA